MAYNIMTFGVRGVDADALQNGNQQLNGNVGPNELTAANLINSNGIPFQQLLLFVGAANNGDLNINDGETAFNLSDMGAGGAVASLGATNNNDPVSIRANGLTNANTVGDLTANVYYENTRGFGLANVRDKTAASSWLNSGDSLTFSTMAINGVNQFIASVSFVVNVNGGGSEHVIIDFDGNVVRQDGATTALDGIDLGVIANGTTVALNFGAHTISIGATTRAMTATEISLFEQAGLNQVTIGSHNTSNQGFAIKNLSIVATDTLVSGVVVQAPATGGETRGTANDDILIGSTVADVLNAGAGNDVVYGGGGADTIDAGDGNDRAEGGDGNDIINGGAGNDIIVGGVGDDTLTGGAGADAFVFRSLNELSANTDHITDLAGLDTIDFSAMNGLVFIGQDAFSAVAGQVRFEVGAGTTTMQIDADGDGVSDHRVIIDNGQFNLTETAPGSLVFEVKPIVGTAGDDVLNGTNQFDDELFGLAGADNLSGGDRNDTLDGGDGDDVIDGGAGIDTASYAAALAGVFVDLNLQGSAQDTLAAGFDTLTNIENVIGTDFDDVIFGNGFDNTLSGGAGDDFIRGGGGNDRIFGGNGEDSLVGFSGSDTLFGGDGNDFLLGNTGAVLQSTVSEFIYGGAGDDFMRGGTGDDVLDGGDGKDRVSYFGIGDVGATVGVTIDLSLQGIAQNTGGGGSDTITSIEDVSGSEFGDTLTGSDEDEFLHGGGGDDIIDAGGGNDVLYGGVFNGLGNDFLDGADGIDTVDFNLRDPRTEGVIVNLGTHTGGTVSGGEVDTLNNIENVIGTAFDDTITGDDNNDNVLTGLGGDDYLDGGAGIDTVNYEENNPLVGFVSSRTEGVSVDLAAGVGGTISGGETDTLISIENVVGTSFDDEIFGNGLANILNGLGGADLINGNAGDDVIDGGDGDDTLNGGDGVDTIYGGAGNDFIILQRPNNPNVGFGEFAYGGDGDDAFRSSSGNDLIDGGNGTDRVTYFSLGSANDVKAVHVDLNKQNAPQDTGDGGWDTLISIENVSGTQFGNDVLIGNDEANLINGNGGSDTLTGGGGADTFVFITAGGPGDIDHITDFSVIDDTISLDSGIFGLAPGALSADAFHIGSEAADVDDRIIYDSATGELWFDADGSGAGAAVHFATLNAGMALTSADFIIGGP